MHVAGWLAGPSKPNHVLGPLYSIAALIELKLHLVAGVKLVLPALLGGLDTKQWRAKQVISDSHLPSQLIGCSAMVSRASPTVVSGCTIGRLSKAFVA